MPDGKQRQRKVGPKSLQGRSADVNDIPPDTLALMNSERSPSEQISHSPLCGARRSINSYSDEERTAYEQSGQRFLCKRGAGYGTDHLGFGYCKNHGGNTPAGRKAGAKAMGRQIIDNRRAFGDKDDALNNVSPEQALLEEVRRSVALVRWLEERISNWSISALEELNETDRSTYDTALAGLPALMTETVKGTPMATDAHSWLILYREERQHMVRVSKMAIDAGIQERMVKIAEDQGRILATAIRAVLEALSLSPDQTLLVPQVVPSILRQVSIGLTPQIVEGKVLEQ